MYHIYSQHVTTLRRNAKIYNQTFIPGPQGIVSRILRAPQTVNVCNHCSAIIMQCYLCNLCWAIFAAVQYLLCNRCCACFAFCNILLKFEKPLDSLCFCIQSARKPYKTCIFCNMLLEKLKIQRVFFVLNSDCRKTKPVPFAIICWMYWRPNVFLCLCIESVRKPCLTNAVCNMLLEKLEKHRLSFVFELRAQQKRCKTWCFFHRNTYTSIPGDGLGGREAGQLFRTKVRTPEVQALFGEIYSYPNKQKININYYCEGTRRHIYIYTYIYI